MQYEQPRKRITSFSAGLLSGNLLTKEGAFQQVQSNLNFRVESAREMLMGLGGGDTEMAPLQRRREIRERQMSLIGRGTSSSSSSSRSSRSSNGKSGSIGESRTSNTSSSSRNNTSRIPNMSEVNKGTKARAQERGYDPYDRRYST